MAKDNERPARDNDSEGAGRREAGRDSSDRPYNDRGEKKIFNRRDKGEGREGGERRSYGDRDRREGGERKPYGDRREGGERRSFGGDRERKPYSDRREGDDRGERKPYGDRREGGERRSFGGDRERKPYGDRNEGGERRSFGSDRSEGGERKSFGAGRREDSERRPFRENRSEGGERRPFERREGGEGRSFGGGREERGERRSYGNDRREGGERRSYGGDRREGGERKPYGERKSFGGDRERRPYGDRGKGEDRGERKPYGDRREGGERRSFGGDRERRPYGDRREGGERKSFERRDNKFSKGGDERKGRSYDRDRDGESNPETPNYNLSRYKDNPRIKKTNRKEADEDGTIRLNRYIANAGVCSRREADELILAGEIKVNGEVVTEMGFKVQPSDTVQYGKKLLNREKLVYVLLNKPKDFITTTEDPEGRKTVMSLVEKASSERIFPVGRLDRNTTGLLLFTNDGELAQKLTHPSNEIRKIYQVELDKPITKDDFQKVAEGVELEDGKAEVDDVAMIGDSKKFLGIEIHIGRNRIVRRIFEHLGYEVVSLDRVQYAGLTKKDLPRSEWRYLSEKEVIRLKYFM